MAWLDLTLCIYFCSMDTVPWHWHYLLISPLSDDEMWLAGRRLRTVGAGPHLAWPHNFSTLILNSDHLRLSRQKRSQTHLFVNSATLYNDNDISSGFWMDPPRHCPQGHPQWDPPPLPRAGPPLSPPAPRQNWSRAILRTNQQNTLIYDHLLNEGKPLKLSNLLSTFMAWVEKEFENPVLEFSLSSFGWGLLFSVKLES